MIACVFTFKPAFEGHKNMCTKGTIMHLINGSLSLDGWLLTCYIWYISLDRCVSASCQIEQCFNELIECKQCCIIQSD